MNKKLVRLLTLLLLISTPLSMASEMRNVILIIGDGFDDQHVTMGRNYLAGMSNALGVDQLAFRAAVQVETLSQDGLPIYVADSANTATALATGTITALDWLQLLPSRMPHPRHFCHMYRHEAARALTKCWAAPITACLSPPARRTQGKMVGPGPSSSNLS
jgi:hypothetical protein